MNVAISLTLALLVFACGCARDPSTNPSKPNAAGAAANGQPVAGKQPPNLALLPRVSASVEWLTVEADMFRVGPVAVADPKQRRTVSEVDLLSFRVRLSIEDRAKHYAYRSWAETDIQALDLLFGKPRPALTDNLGNSYEPVSFKEGYEIVGRVKSAGVDAETPATDLLVFAKPVPAAEWIEFTVPIQLAEGDERTLRLRIHGNQIVTGGEDAFAKYVERVEREAGEKRDAEAKRLAAPFAAGEEIFVRNDGPAIAAPSTALLREYLAAKVKMDQSTLKNLDNGGDIAMIDAGARCTVVEVVGDLVKVSIETGVLTGFKLFVQAKQMMRK